MKRIKDHELIELLQLHENATPGGWGVGGEYDKNPLIGWPLGKMENTEVIFGTFSDGGCSSAKNDAALICMMRNKIKSLLCEVLNSRGLAQYEFHEEADGEGLQFSSLAEIIKRDQPNDSETSRLLGKKVTR